MTWPDPKCNKPHKPGDVYRRWEHTPDCNRHAPAQAHRDNRFSEVKKDVEPMRSNREVSIK